MMLPMPATWPTDMIDFCPGCQTNSVGTRMADGGRSRTNHEFGSACFTICHRERPVRGVDCYSAAVGLLVIVDSGGTARGFQ